MGNNISFIGKWLLHYGNAIQDGSTISKQQFWNIEFGISLFF
jgi:hypothetical protein